MPELIPYIKTSNSIWPNRKAIRFHKKLINKHWKNQNGTNAEQLPGFTLQNRSNSQALDISWDTQTVAHLLKRTVTGSTLEEIYTLVNDGMETSIQNILADQELPGPPGEWVSEELPDWNSLSPEDVNQIIQTYHNRMKTFQKWWGQRMMDGGMNITELMTLFWHSYFASAYSKVFYPQAMYQQNNVFRTLCLGNFKDLLRQVTFGPAMMIWLDISGSRKEAPNENFARELMELFTLGVDNYSQDDVVAASHAFTGYVTNGLLTNYDFDTMEGWGYWWTDWHDFDDKTFMGQTGPWTGDDIINMILDRDECAIHICRKIYKWFLYNETDTDFIESMADVLRTNDYEIKPVLEYLFTNDHFYDPAYVGANIQNPVQLFLGSIKRLNMQNQPFDSDFFYNVQHALNMILFEPPDVNGWTGYRSWINSNTFPMRKALLCSLVTGESPFGNFGSYLNVPALAQSLYDENDGNYPAVQVVQKLAFIFFGLPLTESLEERMLEILLDGAEPYDWNINLPAYNAQWNRMEDLLQHMMRIPEFQLS